MGQLRLEVLLDPARLSDEETARRTLREIGPRLLPDFDPRLGSWGYRDGNRRRCSVITKGRLSDGTGLALVVEVGGSALQLHFDTRTPLPPSTPPASHVYATAVVLSLVIGGGFAAWHFRAFWPTAAVLVGVLVASVLADVVRQVRKARIARRQALDEEAAWRQWVSAALGERG